MRKRRERAPQTVACVEDRAIKFFELRHDLLLPDRIEGPLESGVNFFADLREDVSDDDVLGIALRSSKREHREFFTPHKECFRAGLLVLEEENLTEPHLLEEAAPRRLVRIRLRRLVS